MHPCAQDELWSWVTHPFHPPCHVPAAQLLPWSLVSDLVGLCPALSSGTVPRTDAALDTVAAHQQDQQARAKAGVSDSGTGVQVPPMMGHCPACPAETGNKHEEVLSLHWGPVPKSEWSSCEAWAEHCPTPWAWPAVGVVDWCP